MAWELTNRGVLDEVIERMSAAQRQILLAAPYLSEAIGIRLADAIIDARSASTGLDTRLLSALVRRAATTSFLSVKALAAMRDGGVVIASIPNLHAKVVLIDDWALVGSGNLTQAGLDLLNVELGLASCGPEVQDVAAIFDSWWDEAFTDQMDREVARFLVENAKSGGDSREFLSKYLDGAVGKFLRPLAAPVDRVTSRVQAPGAVLSVPDTDVVYPSDLYDVCVYTIKLYSDILVKEGRDDKVAFTSDRKWTTAARHLSEARESGKRMPILLGPADNRDGLFSHVTHWALLDEIDVSTSEDHTTYVFSRLRRLPRPVLQTQLTLMSSGEALSAAAQRGYSTCRTPEFLTA
jgi:hypothetical protein